MPHNDPQTAWLCSCHRMLRLICGNENPSTDNLFVLPMVSAQRQNEILLNLHHFSVTILAAVRDMVKNSELNSLKDFLFSALVFTVGNRDCSLSL